MTERGKGIVLALMGALLLMKANDCVFSTHAHADTTPTTATTGSVIINEIAWMGTGPSTASDEWIELYNNTDTGIALTGWTLYTADGGMLLPLQGSIPSHGYYLIERTDDQTIRDIPADLTISFGSGLHNAGESLILEDSRGICIDTANGNGGSWPAGTTAPDYCTMERVTPQAPDSDSNWASNNTRIRNGTNAVGLPVNGTPKAPNASCRPNLSVAKTGPLTASMGSRITYHLTLSNTGSTTATAVQLTDTLPAEITFTDEESTPGYSQDGQQITWQIGNLPPGETAHLTLTGDLTSCAAGNITNQIDAATPSGESTLADNHAVWLTALGSRPTPPVLINALLYDGIQLNDADEAIQLTNMQAVPMTLDDWELCKYSVPLACKALPAISIPANASVWLARDASAFETTFGFPPDGVLPSWPMFSNSGDEAILRDNQETIIDTLVYTGGETGSPGWSGEAVSRYDAGQALEGQILTRIPDETTGLPEADTGTAADWMQSSAGMGQVRYPGWNLDPLFWPVTATEPATIVVGIAPDNAYDVVAETLLRAQETISIETYALRHPGIVDIVAEKARDGVAVTILLEGSQAGVSLDDDRWQQELWACQQIEIAGGRCYFMIQESDDHIHNRYQYLHAKLILVDNCWLVIGSQNLSETSLPSDNKDNGTYGSRGVVIATNAPALVKRAGRIFALDCDPEHHRDILRWNTAYTAKYGPPLTPPDITITDGITTAVRFRAPLTINGIFTFTLFSAPEAALRQSDALLGLLARAGPGDQVAVEQLYEYPNWGDLPNPRLEAYIEAARRGAGVQILLNKGQFGRDYISPIYTQTLAYVSQNATDEALPLEIAAGDPTSYGIHNKMVLVALKQEAPYVHVGSLNGSENASKVNREIALQIQSQEIYTYFMEMFKFDWYLSNPIYLPVVMHAYTPPSHLLISEVYYAAGTANREWVEIYNPTGKQVDLSAYKLGDAEAPGRYEGMFQFPLGATIAPYSLLVVAHDGSLVPQANFEIYPYNPEIPEMIKHPTWGTGDWTLRNEGDQVLLLGQNDTVVDGIVWGDATYAGLTPHPGVALSTHALQRHPPDQDSDDCARDFRSFPPSPGAITSANTFKHP